MKVHEDKLIDKLLDKWPQLKYYLQKYGIRDTRERDQEYRVLYVNNVKPVEYYGEEPLEYTKNVVVTSKYTLWNFVPKNLYEQFRRVANFYFLIIIIIMLVIPDPPKNPVTNVIPLAIVVIFTAVKQAYEDVLRHVSDREVNQASATVLRNGQLINIKREEIEVGDIVEVRIHDAIPCDILLLHIQNEERTCHVTTANLDGETNLKKRTVPDKIPQMGDLYDLSAFRAAIKCDKPNTELYEFKGTIRINGTEYKTCKPKLFSPLRNENVLLRGCTLKISPVVYGCAIYTGKDTKMMLNSKYKPTKLSQVERTLNKFIIFFMALLCLSIAVTLIGSIVYSGIYKNHWYLKGMEPKFFLTKEVLYYIIEMLVYLGLLSNLIPISMYISIEMQRFIGTKFIEWDLKMYDEKMDQPARANNSDINEDLGQVEVLFSDKTGTLTENEMIFKQFAINGKTYEIRHDGYVYRIDQDEPSNLRDEEFRRFFEVLALCHTVQLDREAKEIYQASSPDEFSFVKFSQKVGIVFEGDNRDPNQQGSLIRTVNFLGETLRYRLLHTLEFDSNRKRMSVILQSLQTKEIFLVSKGAENAIFAKCQSNQSSRVDEANQIITKFGQEGWRTLALAYRRISPSDMKIYNELLNDANNDISERRDERLAQVYDAVETQMELVGATAVEDRLQDKVPETLEALRMAGIKIWVLTGDKRETAINISKSCKHFSPDMEMLQLFELNDINQILNLLRMHWRNVKKCKDTNKPVAYVVDGKTLGYIFKFNFDHIFRDICMMCDAVLCCRMSPAQKAQVVRLIKRSEKKPVTCAIGDGANDVSMIQEAHIGLGIFGKEGRNAARSADFAFAKFKFLKRALLVHGYLYYTRIAILVNYFFYKNLVFTICQLYYAAYNAYSAQSLYHSIYIMFYNIAYTSIPIIFYALFEQRAKISHLERNPALYKTIAKNEQLTVFQFAKWNMLALWHSLVSFYSAILLYRQNMSISPKGYTDGDVEFGTIVFLQVFIVVHIKLLIECRSVTYLTIFAYFCSLLGILIFAIVPNTFISPYPISIITEEQRFYWVIFHMLRYPSVWMLFLVSAVVCVIPDLVIKIIENVVSYQAVKRAESEVVEKLTELRHSRHLTDVPEHYREQARKREKLRRKKSRNSENGLFTVGEYDEQASSRMGASSDEIEMTNRSGDRPPPQPQHMTMTRNNDIDFGQDNLSYHY